MSTEMLARRGLSRRQFLHAAGVMSGAALLAACTAPSSTQLLAVPAVQQESVMTADEIRPFTVDIPEEALDDLRQRILATRWPSKELVADRSQGVQRATLRALEELLDR